MANTKTLLDVPASFSGLVLKSEKTPIAATVANVKQVPVSTSSLFYSFNGGDAEFHSYRDENDKNISKDELKRTKVEISTAYKAVDFDDLELESMPLVANEVANTLQASIVSTVDKVLAGGKNLVPSSLFEGYTNAAMEVDGTIASLIAPLDKISAAGYEATAYILDSRFKGLVRKAMTEGTNTNVGTLDVVDGFSIAGVRVYFRNLGAPIGVVGDFSQAVLMYVDDVEINTFAPENDSEMWRKNAFRVGAKWKVGYGVADQDAFQKLTIAA